MNICRKAILGVLIVLGLNATAADKPDLYNKGGVTREKSLGTGSKNHDPNDGQRTVEWIDSLPNQPQSYKMRDWNKVAKDLDKLLFDWHASGSKLPIIKEYEGKGPYTWKTFGFGAYVGRPSLSNGLTAVLNGKLVGIDKRNQDGHDYFKEIQHYFSDQVGMYGYTTGMKGRQKFKNSTHFNLGFYQLYDDNEDVVNFRDQFKSIANVWHEALGTGMGGSKNGWADFGHWGYDFDTKKLYKKREMPWSDCAGGIAYLQYMAWKELVDPKFLESSDWCIRYLEKLQRNPLIEWDLSYGPYTAARRSSEMDDRRYDTHKLVTWCFEPDPLGDRPGWGMAKDTWPKASVQAKGLIGKPEGIGKLFMSATCNTAINMKGLVRYDDRYARIMGKWLLHAANSARLWYANSLPKSHQQPAEKAWADRYDKAYCLTYEQVQKNKLMMQFPVAETLISGSVNGDLKRLVAERETSNPCQILKPIVESTGIKEVEHIWKIPVDKATSRELVIRAQATGPALFDIYYSIGKPKKWTKAVTIKESGKKSGTRKKGKTKKTAARRILAGKATDIYVKAVSRHDNKPNAKTSELAVDYLYIQTTDTTISPFLTGPFQSNKMPFGKSAAEQTCFAIYMATEVGRLAAGFGTTDVEQILEWDLGKADFFKSAYFPTRLYYNPYPVRKSIHVNVGNKASDLYDTVSEKFLVRNATGTVSIKLNPDSARILVTVPANGTISYPKPHQLAVNGVIVDYLFNQKEWFHESFAKGWSSNTKIDDAKLVNPKKNGEEAFACLSEQASITVSIPTSGQSRMEVSYQRKFVDVPDLKGEFICEFNDGHKWTVLERKVGTERAYKSSWKYNYVDLPSSADNNKDFKLRFRTNYSKGKAYLDNVRIRTVSLVKDGHSSLRELNNR